MNIGLKNLLTLGALLLLSSMPARSEELRIAVAANFADTMTELANRYSARTGHTVRIARASTGKHYAQILQGAPFHVFFAADAERPEQLVASDHAHSDTSFVYAIGKLVLWSSDEKLLAQQPPALHELNFRHLAIAEPKLAPYGKAAREVLLNMGLWESLRSKLVRGENIGQTFQFVYTGNAELGFVAATQLERNDVRGSMWPVPAELHEPIVQKGLVLSASTTAQEFADFVTGPEGRAVILAHGYALPEE